jgi:hypothetical protein
VPSLKIVVITKPVLRAVVIGLRNFEISNETLEPAGMAFDMAPEIQRRLFSKVATRPVYESLLIALTVKPVVIIGLMFATIGF